MKLRIPSLLKSDKTKTTLKQFLLSLLEDTTKFSELWYSIAGTLPQVSYTETTERIFSSSIETINTVGDVFFTEYVADFYRFRLQFKTMVCDSLSTVSPEVVFLNGARISSILTT